MIGSYVEVSQYLARNNIDNIYNGNNMVLYFGYGANYTKDRLQLILGHEPRFVNHGLLFNHQLVRQKFTSLPVEAQKVIEPVWGSDFEAYTIIAGKGVIKGAVWELNPEELEKVEEWEFIGSWREWLKIRIITSDQNIMEVITDKVSHLFPGMPKVDGLDYISELNIAGMKIRDPSTIDVEALNKLRQQLAMLQLERRI
jgi:hypothetical protein